MLKQIERLKREPKEVRDRYAFYVATLATLVIAIIWASSLPPKFSNLAAEVEPTDNDETGGFSRAFSDLRQQAATAIASIKEQWPQEVSDSSVTDVNQLATEKIDLVKEQRERAEAVVSSSTESVSEPEKVGRVVLIATSSSPQKTASSSQ